LNNVKGVIFYGVPHAGGTQSLSNYFFWKHQQINTLNEYAIQSGFFKYLESLNSHMEHLSMDFKNVVHEDLNIYAFGEGLPINKKWCHMPQLFSYQTTTTTKLRMLIT
jgi:hypothetical protein